jgi:PAS domain S-box-containing protein
VEGIFHDITALREASQQIELLAGITEITPASIIVHDAEGIFLYANQRTFDLHGWSRDEFMAKNLHELDVPVSEELIKERILQLRRDGSQFPLHVIIRSIRWNNQDAILSIATDITEQKKAGESLRESEAALASIFRAAPVGIGLVSNRVLIRANDRLCEMTGYSAEELIGRSARILYPDDAEFDRVGREKYELIRKYGTGTVETRWQRKDGEIREVLLSSTPLDPENLATGVTFTALDITERKRAEEMIREANRKLSLLNGITRHDVANQLTILQGFAQIAAQKKGDPVITDYVSKILIAADTIARQIEFTRTYQELGVKEPAWMSIGDVIAHVESRVPIRFSKTCGGVEIIADPMLERVFSNLCDNAVRHGAHVTQVTVRCEREPDGLLIIVEDDGKGIPADEKEKIFVRGYGQHTGLGLFLAREILSITGITIKETGIPGKGARFEMPVPKGSFRQHGAKHR